MSERMMIFRVSCSGNSGKSGRCKLRAESSKTGTVSNHNNNKI